MNCPQCGKSIPNRHYGGLCQGCYKYFKNGGKIHSIPEAGTIAYDEQGKVICHICGKSFVRLGSHIKENHEMTIDEYKERFGLCKRTKTTEKSYSDTMSRYAKKQWYGSTNFTSWKNNKDSKGTSRQAKRQKGKTSRNS